MGKDRAPFDLRPILDEVSVVSIKFHSSCVEDGEDEDRQSVGDDKGRDYWHTDAADEALPGCSDSHPCCMRALVGWWAS